MFEYEIWGVSPYALFEELWAALPSLQKILDFGRPRNIVLNEMWANLQRASLGVFITVDLGCHLDVVD